jgi:hypothetical protein
MISSDKVRRRANRCAVILRHRVKHPDRQEPATARQRTATSVWHAGGYSRQSVVDEPSNLDDAGETAVQALKAGKT